MKRKLLVLLAILTVFAWVPMAYAVPVQVGSFSFGTPGTGLSASAVFIQNSTDLEIDLTNTGGPADVNADILTTLFWSSSTAGLTPVSAVGNNLFTDPTTNTGPQNVVYEYVSGISQYGNNQGVGAAGLGIFGQSNFPPLTGINVDGSDYGIVASFATGTHIPASSFPLVADEVIFHLTLPSADLITIDQVTFQYGTSLSEPHTTVPLPPSALLMGSGLLGLGLVGWRRKVRS